MKEALEDLVMPAQENGDTWKKDHPDQEAKPVKLQKIGIKIVKVKPKETKENATGLKVKKMQT